MKLYAIFFSFTAQGTENIRESPARVETAKEIVRSMGGEMKTFYGILGSEFDTIFIVEAPGEEAVAKMALAIASGGNVRTKTHRLFTEEQYGNLISELP
ncbi:GYD domain-containing protein [Thiohalomonas denitrificans]|uniref:GYD domain-containing protein n=1 Tax=Thiohalomonas denitrificans TaxID=415747 RepID=UPI0026EBCD73|nr:GYD domain-containing protein [Thiohalomonas denitrificans]